MLCPGHSALFLSLLGQHRPLPGSAQMSRASLARSRCVGAHLLVVCRLTCFPFALNTWPRDSGGQSLVLALGTESMFSKQVNDGVARRGASTGVSQSVLPRGSLRLGAACCASFLEEQCGHKGARWPGTRSSGRGCSYGKSTRWSEAARQDHQRPCARHMQGTGRTSPDGHSAWGWECPAASPLCDCRAHVPSSEWRLRFRADP